jgi:ribokinase
MPRIVVVGSSNTDLVVRTPTLPRAGETVLGGPFFQAGGGKGANQAVAAARAGGWTALIAAVGDDSFGLLQLRGLEEAGVETRFVQRLPDQPSGIALIVVDAVGENSIVVAPGANASLLPERIRALAHLLTSADVVLLQHEIPVETVMEAARIASARGTKVILNPAPGRPIPDELLACVSVLTPNESEVKLLTGLDPADPRQRRDAAARLLSRGAGAVVITMGAAGAYLATREDSLLLPAFPVRATDTTGAGDVFNGALAVALGEGRTLPGAVRFASAAAAISVMRHGAQPSAPTRVEIDELLATSPVVPPSG